MQVLVGIVEFFNEGIDYIKVQIGIKMTILNMNSRMQHPPLIYVLVTFSIGENCKGKVVGL